MPLVEGARIGPYEIVGSIACGGMGEVYRARDLRLSRDVALKVLREEISRDSDLVRRFQQEARAVGALNHPNIVTVFDTGENEGVPFIVSELLEGSTLRERLGTGALDARKALDFGTQIARGLVAAHERGIVHRDLKPENLHVTRAGIVKILDFGIAKLTHPGEQRATSDVDTAAHTTPGTVMGTSGYMSPEQVRGLPADERSDIFAFGAVLFEMLAGKRAFKGATVADTMSEILSADPTPALVGRSSSAVRSIVTRCIEKEPVDRFQTARELATALEFAPALPADDTGQLATRPMEAHAPRSGRAGRLLSGALAALVFAVVGYAVASRSREMPMLQYERLTFQLGDVKTGRFTPDGETLVYSAQWGTSPLEIFTTRAMGRASRPIGVRNAIVAAVSSREEIAIILEPRLTTWGTWEGTLAQLPLSGGTPRELLEGVTSADWSPDGKGMAVVHAISDRSQLEFPIGTPLHAPPEPAWLANVRFSPRGDLIAFLEHPLERDGRGDVRVVDLKGNVRTLASGFSTIDGLAWSHDGREVWFGGQVDGGPPRQIHAVTLDGRPRLVTETLGAMQFHDLSSKGTAILTRGTLWTEMRARARNRKDEVEMAGADLSFLSDLTPDGRNVLGTDIGVGGGPNFTTFLQATDGTPAIRLSEGDGQALSPDMKWALVRLRTSPPKLRIEPTGAGEGRDLATGPVVTYGQAVWEPSGRSIVFAGAELNSGFRLYAQAIEGDGDPRALTEEGVSLSGLGRPISPDGKWIVILGGDGVPALYPLAGGEPRPIPTVSYLDRPIGWSRDGRTLFVARYEETPPRVEQVDVVTGVVRPWPLFRPAVLSGLLGDFRILVSPDGESYAYNYVRQWSDLYLAIGPAETSREALPFRRPGPYNPRFLRVILGLAQSADFSRKPEATNPSRTPVCPISRSSVASGETRARARSWTSLHPPSRSWRASTAATTRDIQSSAAIANSFCI